MCCSFGPALFHYHAGLVSLVRRRDVTLDGPCAPLMFPRGFIKFFRLREKVAGVDNLQST